MLEIFLIIVPVFLIILFGYVACATGYLSSEISDTINSLSLKFTLPVLLFRAMYNLDFSQAFHIPMLVGYYAGSLSSFLLAMLLARFLWGRSPGESVAVGFCAFFTNTVFLGLPIVERAFDDEIVTLAYGIIALHAPIVYSVGMISMEVARRDGAPFGITILTTFKAIFSNPLMIGILLGIFVNLIGIEIYEPIEAAVIMIADAALPVAVFGIGVALTRYKLKAEFYESFVISIVVLVFYPLVVFVLTHYVFQLPAAYVKAAVTIAATPAGLNIYIFASIYDRAMSIAASVILISTVLSVFSLTLWLSLLSGL